MEIKKDYDLTNLNTLGISAFAKEFVEIKNKEDLEKLLTLEEFKSNKKIFLGGGSNILFTKDFDGLVILNKLEGIEILKENDDYTLIKSMSGVIWDDLVSFTTLRDLWGIENLAFIPGTVGGAPMQNIGAYGAELKDVLESVEAYDVTDGTKRIFTVEECDFGYRDSIFKNKLKGRYFIGAITLKLSKTPKPNISYKILSDYLRENGITVKNSKEVSDAVSHIRKTKLPDPKIIGNAGSFFKNIFVSKDKLDELLKFFPDLKYFNEDNEIKISSAWLIESCGPTEGEASWKGYRVGNVGVHEKHALVLVNYGGGTGLEIENLARKIIDSVFSKFSLTLTPEVNLI